MKLLNSLVAVLLGSWPFALQADEPRPNLMFIMADDLGWADVAFHGGNAPTPHLDRLASSGLELTQHYVAPVCSPTRAGFLTGRYWSRFGITAPTNERALPWDTVTLPRALQTAGYATCLTGKWHLGSLPKWGPNHFGFEHSYGSLAGGVGPWIHRYKKGPFSVTWHRNEKLLQETGHVTDLIAQEAVHWIQDRDERPFFLYVPFTAVHLPIKEPQEWLDRVPASIEDQGVAREYAASVMHLDAAVGQIVSALEQSGKRDNTLVVFTSDNGGSSSENNDTRYPDDLYPPGHLTGNNSPLRGGKGQLYEGGIRVPTIVSWPGKLPAGRCDQPLHITDWMPTFCALAGYSANQNLKQGDLKREDLKWDGTNIWPTLTSDSPRTSHPLYWAGPAFHSRALRDGDWKLITYQEQDGERSELFHLADDPEEKNNLAVVKTEKIAELKTKMAAIARSDRDAVVTE
jgi:arylsulfatase A-like enzyme